MDKINVLVSEEYTKDHFLSLPDTITLKYFNPKDKITETSSVNVLCIRSRTKINKIFLDQFQSLKLIISATAGQDHIDLQACQDEGVTCRFIPEPSSESASEHTLMLVLLLLRNFKFSQKAIDRRQWKDSYEKGFDVSSLTFGIIGCGRVGSRLSSALIGLGGDVITYDPEVKSAGNDLDSLLSNSDVVSVHVPGGPENNKMVNADFINKMKEDAFLINTSRGSVLCEEAVLKALKSKKLAGVALDVFESEPLTESSLLLKALKENTELNLILTPHAGSWTESAFGKASLRACAEIVSFFKLA